MESGPQPMEAPGYMNKDVGDLDILQLEINNALSVYTTCNVVHRLATR